MALRSPESIAFASDAAALPRGHAEIRFDLNGWLLGLGHLNQLMRFSSVDELVFCFWAFRYFQEIEKDSIHVSLDFHDLRPARFNVGGK